MGSYNASSSKQQWSHVPEGPDYVDPAIDICISKERNDYSRVRVIERSIGGLSGSGFILVYGEDDNATCGTGHKGANFRRFAQGLTLDRLLEHANARLTELKPRFTLERGAGGDMLIQVPDNDMAGEVRGLHNLSGGERFLVSLLLALGLAEMSTAGGVKIESLFIDEGFGALDPESLGQAIALLEHLHATGRRVGVISHVEELKERIPVKIEVVPINRSTSRIEVTARVGAGNAPGMNGGCGQYRVLRACPLWPSTAVDLRTHGEIFAQIRRSVRRATLMSLHR